MVMNNWIEELPEEKIIERFNVQPGDLYRTIETAKWLLHATDELSPVVAKNKEVSELSHELVERVSKGIKRELLPIVALEGVGRVRGRIIFNAGYQTIPDLKHASIEELNQLAIRRSKIGKENQRASRRLYSKKKHGKTWIRSMKFHRKVCLSFKLFLRTVQPV